MTAAEPEWDRLMLDYEIHAADCDLLSDGRCDCNGHATKKALLGALNDVRSQRDYAEKMYRGTVAELDRCIADLRECGKNLRECGKNSTSF